MGKQIILFGALMLGRRALDYFGYDKVYCFVDNFKHGKEFYGKPVISFEELKKIADGYDVVITVNLWRARDVSAQLASVGIKSSLFEELIKFNELKSDPEIAKFRGIHKGKRCFILGNGPSLRIEDLDKLHANGEITFACNLIYKTFSQTLWRPNYYFVCDADILKWHTKEIAEIELKEKFIIKPEYSTSNNDVSVKIRNDLKIGKGNFYYFNICGFANPKNNYFSADPSRMFTSFRTVISCKMQLAAYMGFEEIYLIGVDGTVMYIENKESEKENMHFYEDSELTKRKIPSHTRFGGEKGLSYSDAMSDFYCAEAYSRNNNFRIYNATRGGKLEIFEHIDFDSLF